MQTWRCCQANECGLTAAEAELWMKYFGENAWLAENSGENCNTTKKEDYGRMISRHGSINLFLGSVSLSGLVDADALCELDMQANEDGNNRTIKRTIREIMMETNLVIVLQYLLPPV